jgi:hypothetical protein
VRETDDLSLSLLGDAVDVIRPRRQGAADFAFVA